MKCKSCGATGSPIEHMEYCRERLDAIARQSALEEALAAVEKQMDKYGTAHKWDTHGVDYIEGIKSSAAAIRRLMEKK